MTLKVYDTSRQLESRMWIWGTKSYLNAILGDDGVLWIYLAL